MKSFWDAQAEWSRATFGSDQERGPVGPLKHLRKEVEEAIAAVQDGQNYSACEEITDCLFLVFDSARRAGLSYDDLVWLAFEKLEVNKKRKWNKPTSDEPVEHDRSV